MTKTTFSSLSEDLILQIISKLEHDPRDWARLSCVSTKFSSFIRDFFWKPKCLETIPSIVTNLLEISNSVPPCGWASLHKLSVCCPGLLHAGVLLEHSDFGLERELGPHENYQQINSNPTHVDLKPKFDPISSSSSSSKLHDCNYSVTASSNCDDNNSSWSLFDDLYFDTVYDASESQDVKVMEEQKVNDIEPNRIDTTTTSKKKMKKCISIGTHLASRASNLSREQGIKLLGSRFRCDCLYISDWPGCVHIEEKRKYMIFRGIFKNFKRSRVWRTIKDGNKSKVDLNCAFCPCEQTWDLHSSFCLRGFFGYHDDGEPVVRAYVCENGHVSGAWTDQPTYA